MEPKLLSYKPLTQTILHSDTEMNSLKQQLKKQIQQFEEFQKEKDIMEQSFKQKELLLQSQFESQQQLQQFSNNSLKLSNFMLKAIQISQKQIYDLQTDLNLAKQQISSYYQKERQTMLFIAQFNPSIMVKKIPYKSRLQSVKFVLIFSVRIKRLGKLFKNVTINKLILPGANPDKDLIQFNDFLKVNYIDNISALNNIIITQKQPISIYLNFQNDKIYISLCEILNKINSENSILKSQTSEYQSQIQILQDKLQQLLLENNTLKIQLNGKNSVVEINSLKQLAIENQLLLQKYEQEKQSRIKLQIENQELEKENQEFKDALGGMQTYIIENSQKSVKISELLDEINNLKSKFDVKNDFNLLPNNQYHKNQEQQHLHEMQLKTGQKLFNNNSSSINKIRSIEDFNLDQQEHQQQNEDLLIQNMYSKYITNNNMAKGISARVNQLEERVKLVKDARLGAKIQDLLDF
ncbi:hypothetical protein SS50377_23256 [Spironucleus salmonicida]|uniref:Uncharacterized protein n=1 Tax=Spironucleus salmonicida TaxID=348837 RepID=V6LHN5_9EUKA|nr:hypothetical protein SS50377_23256 [Spironucleus salmonicida]|eukprot:EST44067.1 Hypothetical protein SS50377_16133 [Spironucleus salmonicida]